ncbi:hypothetical protein QQ045_004298 [Rhodiola kirilowii]
MEVKARLDRVLANSDWRALFPSARVTHITTCTSDHYLLLINFRSCATWSYKSHSFKFEPMWLRQKDFGDIAKEAWLNSSGDSQSLTNRLHQCGEYIKRWNGEVFGQVKTKVRILKEKLESIRKMPRDESVIMDEEDLVSQLNEWRLREEIFWRQRSRCKVPDGSDNVLCGPVSELELQAALFQMFPIKAPGPDGFSAIYFQQYWHFLKDTIIRRISKVINEGKLEEGMNETMIILIPKCKKSMKLEEFSPILLCNVTAKIVTKILANRLKTVLPLIISESQSAFIPEWLSSKLEADIRDKRLKGLRICRGAPVISHLFFADDSMFFLKATRQNAYRTKRVLEEYELISGQKINLGKSEVVFSRKIRSEEGEKLAKSWGMWKKVLGWKELQLSAAGKEVMIKAVLQSIPQNLVLFNEALLAKQVWRLLVNPSSLTSRTLKDKYFWDGNALSAGLSYIPSLAWRSIWQVGQKVKEWIVWNEEEQKWWWTADSKGVFSPKSVYMKLKEDHESMISDTKAHDSRRYNRGLALVLFPAHEIRVFEWTEFLGRAVRVILCGLHTDPSRDARNLLAHGEKGLLAEATSLSTRALVTNFLRPGYGCVARDEEGFIMGVLAGFSEGTHSVESIEVQAILGAIEWASVNG